MRDSDDEDDDHDDDNNNNSVSFLIICVLTQQPEDKLQNEHIYTIQQGNL
jgi:hypothetical protein